MIAGNVCMNRMHGIVYPAFEIESGNGDTVQQSIDPVASVDATAMLNVQAVGVEQSSIGMNPGAVAARVHELRNSNG